ncbi:related to CDK9 kinase-activating protein cyclin T [Ramularia collo-cygni]|uniref:RNA polymerase II holoenzyme cyclin-like subunit n=1 Tax=Ramularia collo-cygni TaxID=112498 RepID=A0A2D3URE8_9PEZI|nr:related to CDK9 kinase-activating protein cyclin T [Ramularia collo-cygni]CZT16085.1 related to CDK9 kinase-activating protein cyclin T [Ramularia collo-cygni]
MPPSNIQHLPASHPASRQRPKSPNRVLAEAEAQWIFTEEELANTPSIQDGMSVADERQLRAKGINFIVQCGVMLKLPQLTLSTAAIFFQRYLMRSSLKKPRGGMSKPVHHYSSAATCLFLATKVEESCRKMKEMMLVFCRVAQKNPNLVIDEQSKDFWRWRDWVLQEEDFLLETLCFDLTVESPHRQLYDMLKFHGLEHDKRLRNSAWGFVTDSNNTQLCLLFNSRTIAAASLYAACRYCEVEIHDDSKGRPWWEASHVRLKDMRLALDYIVTQYDPTAQKINGTSVSSSSDGHGSIYAGLGTPIVDEGMGSTRARERAPASASPFPAPESERRTSNTSSIGIKRDRDVTATAADGHAAKDSAEDEQDAKRVRLSDKPDSVAGSEEGEVEE